MSDIDKSKTGVKGDHAHIEGGIHIYGGAISPGGKPLQRPPRVEHFTGRQDELARLLEDLQPGKVVTLWGPGGIGKSALAAEALWRLAPNDEPPERFPDGIICHNFYNQPEVDLALEAIARAYGQEPKPTPRDAALRALAGRGVLLLLDGAEDADDLSAVLEVRGNCGVLVTSRSRKDVVEDRQEMAPLEIDEAVALLQAWGKDQAGDTTAGREICTLVGRLPLAVRLAGRYLEQTGTPAADYLTWLKETPLEALDHGQRRRDSVPLLLARSLTRVGETAAEVLSIVGLLALAPFGRAVLAAALGRQDKALRGPLDALVNYGLLLHQDQQYEVSHALVHTYAQEKVPPEGQTVQRLARYCNESARAQCEQGLEGYRRLDGERPHIVKVLKKCMVLKAWQAARDLAWAVEDYLDVQGHSTARLLVSQTGLDAARRLEDRRDEGAWLGNLGLAYRDLGQVEKAIDYHQQALVIHQEIGYRQGQANQLGNLGLAYSDLGQVEKAIDYHQQALVIDQEIGYRQGQANALGNLGLAYRALGQVEKAIDYLQQALAIFEEIKSPNADRVAQWLSELSEKEG